VFDALFWVSGMKTLAPLLLVALAAAYYFGYEPADFIPSFQASSTPPPKVRRAAPPAEQAAAPAAQPAQRSGGASDDGSLERRWKP
jgi:hypothetical protein